MVARVTLHNMRQGCDEPVRAFGAKLRGQASVCKFTQQCLSCETDDYTEAMIKDVLCKGLENSKIHMDLLGNKKGHDIGTGPWVHRGKGGRKVDHHSNWPIVERAEDGATRLIKTLRHTFATYGIPDELSLEGGPEFVSHRTREFLHQWGVYQRLSSVVFPHSNCRPEVGVKPIKRLITGNVGKDGAININAFQALILQYWNTPNPTTKVSPAVCLFERPVKDLLLGNISHTQHGVL